MFAPPVAKTKTKSAEPQRAMVVPQRPSQAAVSPVQLLQRRIGNQALMRLLAQRGNEPGTPGNTARLLGVLQTKLKIGSVNDPLEHEADRVADQVMRMPEPRLQRACPCGGGCPACQTKQPGRTHDRLWTKPAGPPAATSEAPLPGPLQAKLKVGAVDDPLEHEADRVADQVMRMPAPAVSVAAAPPQLSRKCAECEEEEKLQTKPAGPQAAAGEAPAIVHEVLRSPGQPLDAATRAFMEPRFGNDFSQVRVHTGSSAEQSARDVNGNAYTVGHDIVFGAGRFAPGTQEGRRLLAHELAHTMQRSSHPSATTPGAAILQRAPAGGTDKPTTLIESLEAIGQRIARLAFGPKQVKGEFFRGKVITVVRDNLSGEIFVGLNTGVPENLTDAMGKAIEAQKARIKAGEVKIKHDIKIGEHSEVNALNQAIAAREKRAGHKVTEAELDTFELHNVWLSGPDRRFTTAPRCEHCARISRSVSVTQSVFFAEGGVAGEITVPQSGSVTLAGGTARPVTSASGEITTPGHGSVTPAGGTAKPVTTTTGGVTVPQRGSVTPAGGTARPVTSASGEVTVPQRGAVGGAVRFAGATALQLVLELLATKLKSDLDNETIKSYLQAHESNIQGKLNALSTKVDELRLQSLAPIYANITLKYTYATFFRQIGDEVSGSSGIVDLVEPLVDVSTSNINETKTVGTKNAQFMAKTEYIQLVYSVALEEEPSEERRKHPPGTGAYAASIGKSLVEIDRMTHWLSKQDREQFIHDYIRYAREHPDRRAIYEEAIAAFPGEL